VDVAARDAGAQAANGKHAGFQCRLVDGCYKRWDVDSRIEIGRVLDDQVRHGRSGVAGGGCEWAVCDGYV
jgi:hypothetical protein